MKSLACAVAWYVETHPFFVVEWIACVYVLTDPCAFSHFKLHACAEIRKNCQKPENMLLHRPGEMLVNIPPPPYALSLSLSLPLAVEYKIVVLVENVRDDLHCFGIHPSHRCTHLHIYLSIYIFNLSIYLLTYLYIY